MTNADDEYVQYAVLYVADDSVVADSVAPVIAELWACQCFAQTAWIGLRCDLVIHVVENASRSSLV